VTAPPFAPAPHPAERDRGGFAMCVFDANLTLLYAENAVRHITELEDVSLQALDRQNPR